MELKKYLNCLNTLISSANIQRNNNKKQVIIIINKYKLNMLSEEILSKHCLMMMSYKEYALRSWNKHEQNK